MKNIVDMVDLVKPSVLYEYLCLTVKRYKQIDRNLNQQKTIRQLTVYISLNEKISKHRHIIDSNFKIHTMEHIYLVSDIARVLNMTVDLLVEENFGYSPNDDYFDAILDERNKLYDYLKKENKYLKIDIDTLIDC